MNSKKIVMLSLFAIMIMATAQIVFAQEAAVAPVDPEVVTSNQEATLQKDNDMQWAWGEVTNLDNQAKTVTLKYLDYETDQEKELVLVVDEKTTFENIQDFNELKLMDTLSIDYTVGADNKNIAKNISFEKPEALSSDSTPAVPAQTAVPDVAQPIAQSETPVDSSKAADEAPAAPEPVSAAQGQVQ